MIYQTSFLQPENTSTRYRPRHRKGESWDCIRYETWQRINCPEKTLEQKKKAIKINEEFRENCLRSSEVFCYLKIEKSKKENKPDAVWFWFGGEIAFPGIQSQYVTQSGLELLLKFNNVKASLNGKKQKKRRVSFGGCFG